MDYFKLSTKRNSRSGAVLRGVFVPVLCLIAVLWCFAGHADITYANFPDAGGETIAGMTLNRNAAPCCIPTGPPDNRLRLTVNGYDDRRAAAWYNTKQYVGDDWETTFTFKFTSNDGDGFTFAIQNSPDSTAALGTDIDGGSGKGYAGITNCWIVEFDAYNEDISVHSNGTAANRHNAGSLIATAAFTPDDSEHIVSIEHAAAGAIEVFLDDMVTPVLTIADSQINDIGWDGGAAYVGFTAGTGGAEHDCDIIDWSFTVTDTLPPTNPGVGCNTHVFPSPETTMVIRWSGAEDLGSGVDGYSFELDSNPTTTPDTTVDLDHTSDPHTVSYDALGEGTYYFHLRTHDNAGRWSDTKHIGPLVVDFAAPPLPVAGPVVIGLAAGAIAVAGARALRRRRRA